VHSYRANQPIQAVDTVVTFGCFDLFHPLHQRLIDNASIIGKQVIVYVYNKEYKKKGDQLVRLTNNVQHRITNVIEYATKNNIKITAVRMEGKHLPALRKAISSWSLRGSVAVFGGDDQFADYPELLDLCYTMKTPIVSISRGDIKGKLCSSDIREQQSYQRLAAIYHIDLAQVSPAFWKKRIHSLVQAKEYLKKQANLGAGTVDILKFNPTWPVDQRITKPVQSNDKLVICLPGRTPSTLDRVRKILLTMEQLIPAPLVDTVQRYLICYEDNGQNTRDYIDALAQNPYDFFSDEAMEIVRCLIMPRVSQAISIRSEERGWCVNKTSEFARKPWPEILQDLTQVTLWARSRGSVLLIEIENAFRYCMLTLDYSEDEIGIAAQCIGAVAISNLAPLSRDRLFSTISVTGINDKVAQSYIPDLLEIAHSKISQSSIDITMSAINHCVVIAQIPSQIITDEGTLIYDEKCHYTPLYMSLRQSEDANTLPLLVREAMGKMISREKPFDFEEIKQPVSETLCSRVAAPHY
jgi:cytidyltransferase-like protein